MPHRNSFIAADRSHLHEFTLADGTPVPPAGCWDGDEPQGSLDDPRACLSRHRVGRRTIALGLASAEPPQRKKIHREPAALNGLHAHIDAMMDADPAIGTATIWQRLANDHGTTVAYYTLRTYVVSRRVAALQAPGVPPARLSATAAPAAGDLMTHSPTESWDAP